MSGLRWLGQEDVLEIGPFHITSPLVYSYPGAGCDEPSAILLRKAIEAPSVPSCSTESQNHFFSYYSRYRDLDARQRWQYLSWLEQGRPSKTKDANLHLFLRGLERRSLLEGQDTSLIWDELWRLQSADRGLYDSFNRAARQLLFFLLPRVVESVSEEQIKSLTCSLSNLYDWNIDGGSHLSLLVWWCAQRKGALPAWMAYHCARVNPNSRRTIVVERAETELQALFTRRFHDRWGEIIPLALPPKARRKLRYRPCNHSLNEIGTSWLDPLRLTGLWANLQGDLSMMFNACQDVLRPLALALGKEGITRQSPVAWEATPVFLRTTEHPFRPKLLTIGGVSLTHTGFAATNISTVAEAMQIVPRGENSQTFTPDMSRRLAASIEMCDLGIEPDARLTGKAYGWNAPCVLFMLPDSHHSTAEVSMEDRNRYQACAFLLKVAFFVAQAGEGARLKQNTLTLIAEYLQSGFSWTAVEHRRIKALAALCMMNGVEATQLRVPSSWNPEMRGGVGRLLLQLVAQDGQVSGREESALRLAWKRLGLEIRGLTCALDDLSSRGIIFLGGCVSPGAGERIPPPPAAMNAGATFQLDREALAALMEDTRHVQEALYTAMLVEEKTEPAFNEPPVAGAPEQKSVNDARQSDRTPRKMIAHSSVNSVESQPDASAGRFEGLAPRFCPFFEEILKRDVWLSAEAEDLARRHNLMLSGAVETINEWAFDELGEQVIWDEGGQFSVVQSLVP